MAKDKKINGWSWDLFISDDEKLIATSNSRNGIYVYDLETLKPVLKTKTVSYVGYVAVSPDRKRVAAKNTSGLLALLSMETGEEICRNKMAESEGYLMTFTDDSKHVLDLDHWGRTMLLDIISVCWTRVFKTRTETLCFLISIMTVSAEISIRSWIGDTDINVRQRWLLLRIKITSRIK